MRYDPAFIPMTATQTHERLRLRCRGAQQTLLGVTEHSDFATERWILLTRLRGRVHNVIHSRGWRLFSEVRA